MYFGTLIRKDPKRDPNLENYPVEGLGLQETRVSECESPRSESEGQTLEPHLDVYTLQSQPRLRWKERGPASKYAEFPIYPLILL